MSLLTMAGQVVAQADQLEEIVVTGSLIRGTPEDAALPVEVFSVDELREIGNPTALEFAKTLTSSGPTTGEAYYFGGSGNTGNVGYNLRGIGADKTLTLFNGRRSYENASMFPSAAVQRVEILKDGAAVTYGADATGGVVNFITRNDFEGFELQSSYKAISGSDGEWNMSALGGWDVGDTNFMIAAEWDHRSELDAIERDFTNLPNAVNPAPWSTLTNLAGWVPRGSLPATPGNTANGEWGSPLGLVSDFDQSSCEAVGGVYVNSYTCKYNYIPYYNLVEDSEFYRLFGQVTSDVSDTMQFYVRGAFARNYRPHQYGSPSQPVIRGPARANGATYQIYVPVTNPYVASFMDRTGWSSNSLAGFTQGFTPITYRAFAHGGNDVFAEGNSHSTPNTNDSKYMHVSSGVNGMFDISEREINYDVALTYNHFNSEGTAPDIVGSRLQQALNGFGGPNCNAQDLDPTRFGTQNPGAAGTNGCQWYNPFASNFAGQPVLGLANPAYDASQTNDPALIAWLFDPREVLNTSWNITLDAVFSGDTGLELPGGGVAWGAGIQWRDTQTRDTVESPLYNGSQPCAWEEQVAVPPEDPRYTGCLPDEPGPFFFFGTNEPSATSQEQFSYFLELNLPIFDTLNMTAAVRNESFTGDLEATVYKFSGKWDITNNLAMRGSYGDNYQAPPASVVPGEVNNGVNSYTIAAGNWRGAQTVTNQGIQPETATVWSAGLIWDSTGFADDHDFRFIIDYFDLETQDELGLLASANTIAEAVFSIAPDGSSSVPTDGSALADCAHPMVARVTFNGGACVQGVTTADDFSNVRTAYGNGPGQHTAGFDIQMDYSMPLGPGEFRFSTTITKVEKFEFSETVLDGVVLDPGDDRLGTLNFATIANAAPELRANVNFNYSWDAHNLRLVFNHIDGVVDERYVAADGTVNEASLIPSGLPIGGTGTLPPSYYGVFGDDWLSTDLHYVWDWEWATINFSIVNIADENPPESRQEMGYDPRIGNPLGRTFEIGIRKTF
jgi:outer membrane receptor protein involved in Fe transport